MFPYQRGGRKEDQCNEDSNVFMYDKLFWIKPKIDWIKVKAEDNSDMTDNKVNQSNRNGNQSQTKSSRNLGSSSLIKGDKVKNGMNSESDKKSEEDLRNSKLKSLVEYKKKTSSIINPIKDKEDKDKS